MTQETYSATATARGQRIDGGRPTRPSRRETASKRAPGRPMPAPRAPSVMVVDDDAATARMMSLALREDGYSVRSASDGREALHKLEAESPDVILLDHEMPGMNGRAFYRELRARGLDVPVVIVSAFDARAGQRELGAATYLTKPFDPDDLLDKVRALLK